MWRSKKFLLVAVLGIVLLAGSIGGVALANTESGDDSLPKTRYEALLDKVCEIYNANPDRPGDIDCDVLKAAFAEAQSVMRDEALDSYLQKLVADGVIDSDQATAYKEWLRSKPDMEPFRQQLEEWGQARPDVPIGFGFGGRGGFRGMGGMRGFGGPCFPMR